MNINKVLPVIYTVFCLYSCNANTSQNINATTTQQVLDHHWETFENNDLEGVMEDYTEESILVTPEATFRGLDEIRQNFVNAFSAFPKAQSDLQLIKSVVEEDLAYILWEADTPEFKLSFATDSFLIRDGKIIRQTYAGVALPK
jgi:hypothetical protein